MTMVNLNINSLSVHGIKDNVKYKQLFKVFRDKKKADIIYIQEAHCSSEIEKLREMEWGGGIFFNEGESNARGVMILFRKQFQPQVKKISKDKYGCTLAQSITIDDHSITLCNIYAPNIDSPEFFRDTINLIEEMDDTHRIIGGTLIW